jgi:hypothetical protein
MAPHFHGAYNREAATPEPEDDWRNRLNLRTTFAAAMLPLVAGCAPDHSESPTELLADTLRMEVVWEVARGRHPASDSLGQVTGVALDLSGNVYVSDRMAAKIWVFDADGRLLTPLGRAGQGPGEFEAPTGLAVGPDGRLYVRDVYRVSRFAEDPETGLLTRFEASFDGPLYADWTSVRTTRFDAEGALLYPGSRWLDGGTASRFFLRFSAEGEPLDTIHVPSYENAPQLTAFVRVGAGGGRMLPGLNHVPFSPLPAWDVTRDGTVVSGTASSYLILETDRDGTVLRRFERPVELARIPREEYDDSVRALRHRLDAIPVGLDQVEGVPEEVIALDLPDRYPAYQAIYAATDDEIWVRRWTPAGDPQTVLDVFGGDGQYRETVVLPRFIEAEPTPVLSREGVIGVALDPVTGESQIITFHPVDPDF